MKKILLTTVLLFVAAPALAKDWSSNPTPWTIDRGDGVHIPNPKCWSDKCKNTGDPDKPKPVDPPSKEVDHNDPAPLHDTAEVHNGFSCYYPSWDAWVYHAAARPNMTPEHDASAKGEALDRLGRIGDDRARELVCRKWQIDAGFKIAKVL